VHRVVRDDEESLLEENRRLREARTCKVCMDREVNTVFVPCGHLVCCSYCALIQLLCPVCEKCIVENIRVSNLP